MENYILTVGGISSLDYGIYVLDSNDEDSTTRDYESVQVDGRSGDLHFDNGRWANVDRTYKCVCMENARQNIPAFVAAIMSNPGYKRLEDTLHYDYYKIGALKGEVVPKFSRMKDAARFDITFDCKPQKYLKIGERQITLSGTNTIMNPTYFDSSPALEITGNGQIGIGGETITIAGSTETIILDLELGDCYSKASHANKNSCVTWTDKPVLKSGINNITVASGLTVLMTPRWWHL